MTEPKEIAKRYKGNMGIPEGVSVKPELPTCWDEVTFSTQEPGWLHWGVDGWRRPPMDYWTDGTKPFDESEAVETPLSPDGFGRHVVTLGPFFGRDIEQVHFAVRYTDGHWSGSDGTIRVLRPGYPLDTYLSFSGFAKTVLMETKLRLRRIGAGDDLEGILTMMGKTANLSLAGLSALTRLTAAGRIVYFGSVGALLASNPLLGGALMAWSGLGKRGVVRTIFRERAILRTFKATVVDSFSYRFDALVEALHSPMDAPPADHVLAVDQFVDAACSEFLHELAGVGKLSRVQLERLYPSSRMLTSG